MVWSHEQGYTLLKGVFSEKGLWEGLKTFFILSNWVTALGLRAISNWIIPYIHIL